MWLRCFQSYAQVQLSWWRCMLVALFLCYVASSANGTKIGINHKSCGIPAVNVRIVNGLIAPKDKFPWVAFLYVKYRTMLTRCAGAIITSYHVLTAGHCTMLSNTDRAVRITMYYGHNEFRQGRVMRVARYYVHEHFVVSTFYADIALLNLNVPIEFTPSVRTICLPPPAPASALVGKTAVVAGWGVLKEGGKGAANLRYTTQVVLPPDECTRRLPTTHFYPDVMICAYKKGSDACQGDSGAPLIVENSRHVFEVIGLVSFGDGCNVEGRPGIYTNVSHFIPWIRKAVEAGSDKYVELQ